MTTQFNSPLTVTSKSHQGGFGRRVLLGAMLAGAMLLQAHLVFGAPAFVRGTASSVGPVRFSSTPDFVTITGDYTAPGFIDNTLNIPIGRIQYDMINSDQGSLNTWTVYYSPLVGPSIIGATTPIGYVDFFGTAVPQGGAAYGTLLNAGYGLYNYNTGAPWTIDYEVDHITFIWVGAPTTGLPPNAGVGDLAPTSFLPSFDIEFDPSLPIGLVPTSAKLGAANFNGQV